MKNLLTKCTGGMFFHFFHFFGEKIENPPKSSKLAVRSWKLVVRKSFDQFFFSPTNFASVNRHLSRKTRSKQSGTRTFQVSFYMGPMILCRYFALLFLYFSVCFVNPVFFVLGLGMAKWNLCFETTRSLFQCKHSHIQSKWTINRHWRWWWQGIH